MINEEIHNQTKQLMERKQKAENGSLWEKYKMGKSQATNHDHSKNVKINTANKIGRP